MHSAYSSSPYSLCATTLNTLLPQPLSSFCLMKKQVDCSKRVCGPPDQMFVEQGQCPDFARWRERMVQLNPQLGLQILITFQSREFAHLFPIIHHFPLHSLTFKFEP
ncbi:unnamed protein product [Mycena citricolor]|uniref:Uncharacterized protein n=1 Tax=Mycena citricolor TaxID=2018698 RepID=A0AAD2H1D9_9AGAR|nr:unnamed protein product [Mycena citricolor]